jgi:hypothetical protein
MKDRPNDKPVRVKKHKSHRMDANSVLADGYARPRRPGRIAQILEQLAGGPGTTLMLAQQLGCHPSDLTRPMLDLRERGVVLDAGGGRDPITGRWAHFWTTTPPTMRAAGGG